MKRRQSHRNAYLKRRYGITSEDYDRMCDEQGGVCAICEEPEGQKKLKYLSVDHDHKTGTVRGLLCHRCNKVLGMLREDIGVLWEMMCYITKEEL